MTVECFRKILGVFAGILIILGFIIAFIGWEGTGVIMVVFGAILTLGAVEMGYPSNYFYF